MRGHPVERRLAEGATQAVDLVESGRRNEQDDTQTDAWHLARLVSAADPRHPMRPVIHGHGTFL